MDNASRLFYVDDRGTDVLKRSFLPVDQVNQMFGTHFTDGLFRMIFVKFDFWYSFERLNTIDSSLLGRADKQIRVEFSDLCSDVICTRKSDGIMAVLNYDKKRSHTIDTRIQSLYESICRIIHLSQDREANVTICVSAELDDPCSVWQIKEQVRDAEWSRMALGTNRVIFWTKNSIANDPSALARLNQIRNDVKSALEQLDLERFRQSFQEFYQLPHEILLSREARRLFKEILYMFFEMYWGDTISKFTNPAKAYDEIAYCSHLCTTFETHQSITISKCIKLLRTIAEQAEKKYSSAVSDAITYVRNNIDKPISLKAVAEAAHFSQGYFSYLFKKETGTNFSKFVSEAKNQTARELLSETNMSISEVAFRVGFPEVRAFSKHFKAANNITPSRYRKLHKKAADEISI